MNLRKLIAIVIILLASYSGIAQEAIFKAFAVHGNCLIQRGDNPDEYVKVQRGINVFSHDKIIITGSGSYVGLSTLEGKSTELTKAGVFFVDELVSGLVSGQPVVVGSMMDLLAVNMVGDVSETERYRMYSGSGTRAGENEDIALFLPIESKISPNPSSIEWKTELNATNYKLEIRDLFDDVIYSYTTESKSAELNFGDLDLSPGEPYRLKVWDESDPSKKSSDIALKFPTRSELAKFETEMEMLSHEVPANSAIADMVFATYCEENGLYLQAIPLYQSAIEKEPEIIEYQNAYKLFLYKIGIDSLD